MSNTKSFWMPSWQVFVFTIAVLLVTAGCITLSLLWESNPDELPKHDRTKSYGDWALVGHGTKDAKDLEALKERLNNAFERRIEQYQKNLESQNSNLWYQVLCIAIAVIIVLKSSDHFKVPGIDAEVRISWVYWALPLCLLYLWMSFGFRLHELIDSRIALYKIAQVQLPQSDGETTENWYAAARTFGNYPAVNDGGIMDGWFISFRYNYTLEPDESKTDRVLYQIASGFSMFLFGIFLGISNGTIPGLLLHGKKRFAQESNKLCSLINVAFFLTMGILIFTHLIFWYGGQHINWLQPVAAISCCLTVWVFEMSKIPKERWADKQARGPGVAPLEIIQDRS